MKGFLQDTLLMDEADMNLKKYSFELPTKVTKLEPVFLLSFNIEDSNNNQTVYVTLNPKLADKYGDMNVAKQYKFNSDGSYVFEREEFNDYYIDGEMRLIESENYAVEKSCFVSISYGNEAEALHFIKGNFKLTENIN